jgi:hypothetical protein
MGVLTIDDLFVSDELSFLVDQIKEPGEGAEPPMLSTEIAGEFSKRITPSRGFSIGGEFRHLKPDRGAYREWLRQPGAREPLPNLHERST